jgi:UDP-N-acetylglucosamine--N-acetylmuramyl-(pentapeptide) pyrophosphoryl-undecaprenol N-acetylglucosamine transferase
VKEQGGLRGVVRPHGPSDNGGMSARHYVLAGGGTGGHLFPGIAVAEALRRAEPDAQITFFTTGRPLDQELLSRTPYRQVAQPVQPFTLRPWRWLRFFECWRRSVRLARQHLAGQPPQAVLGLGGYAAGPPVVVAGELGIPTALLNPDAIPGRANRYLARRVDVVILQWEVSRAQFPSTATCYTLGCPIRAEFAAEVDAVAARRHFGLAPDRPVALVTGASQGARNINEAMVRAWPEFLRKHPQWQLLHLTGPASHAEVLAAYAAAKLPVSDGARAGAAVACGKPGAVSCEPTIHVIGFTHDMHLALAAADIVIARAGASTLAELTAVGRPAILLPYPYHRDQHQLANARVLAEAGAALVVDDRKSAEANWARLLAAMEELAHEGRRREMAAAARRLGRPDAAEQVALWMRSAV